MFFKQNIQPKWEDPQNEKGGRFVIHLNDINIENFWNRLLFSILGNDKFLVDNDLSDLINGFLFLTRESYSRLKYGSRTVLTPKRSNN